MFLDLTLSLNDVQQQSIDNEIQRLCDGLQARSHLVVFPLGGYVQKAGILLERHLPDDKFAVDRSDLNAMRQGLPGTIRNAARAYVSNIKDPEFVRHTCISDAIRQAEQVVRDQPDDTKTEIVFISDMLEDCPHSLLNGYLSLEKHDISREISQAEALPATTTLADLHSASVTCVIPVSGPTPTKTRTPEPEALRAFWGAVFSHCHQDDAAFRLNTTLPPRLHASASARP